MHPLTKIVENVAAVSFIGLAKNAGKTEALRCVLEQQPSAGAIGITSIGRDGEAYDVLDPTIRKPRLRLTAGTLVATTQPLLRASALLHEVLEKSTVTTPLGRVVVARALQDGFVEVAGPSTGHALRWILDRLQMFGASRSLIDGALDRRLASAPEIADGVVLATGAVVGPTAADVYARTRAVADLVTLPAFECRGRQLLSIDLLTALRGELPTAIREETRRGEDVCLGVEGPTTEKFLMSCLRTVCSDSLTVVAKDSTRIFLRLRSPAWFADRGLHLSVKRPQRLLAITVNPACGSGSLPPHLLLSELRRGFAGIPVLDVRSA